MSYVDDLFVNELQDILKEEWENDNRAKWTDETQVQTKRIIQSFQKYDLSKGFPITSLREINWKAAIDEIIWVYIKQSNNVKDLNSKIWNSWANEKGEVEAAYGHQIAKPTMGYESQMHYVLNEIKTNPSSRRIMMNMFDTRDQNIKATRSLIECAYATHFTVKGGKLHMTLLQRSGDEVVAAHTGGWNCVQYSFLQHAIAQECGLEVGTFTHFIQDKHMYNKHQDTALELIGRYYESEDTIELPQIKIANKSFFDLNADDVELIRYENKGKIKRLEVAI